MLEKANKVRIFNAMKNKEFLYEKISKMPGITAYELAKEVDWSFGKVQHYVQKLLEDHIIKNSTEVVNNRVQRKLSPVSYRDLVKREEMNFLKDKDQSN